MASRKSSSDWDRIELEYLAGEDSIREIADRHEISEGAIRKRAKAEKWVRPVRKARTLRTLPEKPQFSATFENVPTEPVAPTDIADRGRALVVRMLDELDTVTSRMGELEEMIEEETDGDRDGGRREAMMKALSLGNRALTVKTLASAFKTLNEAAAPQGKKAQQQQRANEVASRFRGVGPPTLKAVK